MTLSYRPAYSLPDVYAVYLNGEYVGQVVRQPDADITDEEAWLAYEPSPAHVAPQFFGTREDAARWLAR